MTTAESSPRVRAHRGTLLILAATVLVLSGCSLDNRGTPTSSEQTTAAPPPEAFGGQAPTPPPSTDRIPPVGGRWLETEQVDGLGTIVVDGVGRTVYASSAEDVTGEPGCYDLCAETWLPLLASGDPAGGIGIQASAVGTATRRDGSQQVTYQGHPLYWYAGDGMPGEINGHGVDLFGVEWFVLTPDGDPATVG